jgi:hypothetical protein
MATQRKENKEFSGHFFGMSDLCSDNNSRESYTNTKNELHEGHEIETSSSPINEETPSGT